MECDIRKIGSDTPNTKKMKPGDDEEYDKLVSHLTDRLKIARHSNRSVSIKAARLLIEHILSRQESDKSSGEAHQAHNASNSKSCQLSGRQNEEDGIRIQQSKFIIDDVPLPKVATLNISTDTISRLETRNGARSVDERSDRTRKKDELDSAFELASKSLKLLYLNDQKQLQYRVNEIISSIQEVTAEPQIDVGLGSVGR